MLEINLRSVHVDLFPCHFITPVPPCTPSSGQNYHESCYINSKHINWDTSVNNSRWQRHTKSGSPLWWSILFRAEYLAPFCLTNRYCDSFAANGGTPRNRKSRDFVSWKTFLIVVIPRVLAAFASPDLPPSCERVYGALHWFRKVAEWWVKAPCRMKAAESRLWTKKSFSLYNFVIQKDTIRWRNRSLERTEDKIFVLISSALDNLRLFNSIRKSFGCFSFLVPPPLFSNFNSEQTFPLLFSNSTTISVSFPTNIVLLRVSGLNRRPVGTARFLAPFILKPPDI